MEENMTIWKCNKCGSTIEASIYPDTCPSCKEKCEYVDVTCYLPECGGPTSGNINPQVFKESSKADERFQNDVSIYLHIFSSNICIKTA